MEKKLIFKYTVKIPSTSKIETHYVSAYTEELARIGLSKALNVDKDILRLSNKNLPFKVRLAIEDPNNKEYFLTVDVNVSPMKEVTFHKQQEQHFDLRSSVISSLKYNVMALARHDKEILLKYSGTPEKVENFLKQQRDSTKSLFLYSPAIAKTLPTYKKNDVFDYYTFGEKAFMAAYTDLRNTITKEGLEDLLLANGQNALDVLDSLLYSVNISEDNYDRMKKSIQE